jgi:hypothetical protein
MVVVGVVGLLVADLVVSEVLSLVRKYLGPLQRQATSYFPRISTA